MIARALRRVALSMAAAALALFGANARADELPEYRLKAAFIYNFIAFTEWPADAGATLNVCIHGQDPFAGEIDGLQGKTVGSRSIALQRKAGIDALRGCQVVFIAASAQEQLPRVLEALRGQTVLTIADSAGAMRRGVALNMNVAGGKVTFEANTAAARAGSISLSSKLLRLATEVQQ
jgi:YfiR/HmsC-like